MTQLLVGQVWSDNDPRSNRKIKIEELPQDGYRRKVRVSNVDTGRTTFIDPKRFNPNSMTGYTLVNQPSDWEKTQEERFIRARTRLHGMPIGDDARLNPDHQTVTVPLDALVNLGESI